MLTRVYRCTVRATFGVRQTALQLRRAPVWSPIALFHNTGIAPELVKGLEEDLKIVEPSFIQSALIQALLRPDEPALVDGDKTPDLISFECDFPEPKKEDQRPMAIVAAAETGSGKTLGYALPVLHQLFQSSSSSSLRDPNKKQLAVLVTVNRQLCEQIEAVISPLAARLGLRIALAHGITPFPSPDNKQDAEADILITTPSCFFFNLGKYPSSDSWVHRISTIVFDEADTIAHQQGDFQLKLFRWVRRFLVARPPQFLFVGATFPNRGEDNFLYSLCKEFPRRRIIESANVHRCSELITNDFVHLSEQVKPAELLDILLFGKLNKSHKKILVFCNTVSSCQDVARLLTPYSTLAVKDELVAAPSLQLFRLRKGLSNSERMQEIAKFERPLDEEDERERGLPRVMVCTSLGMRGFDFKDVTLVVQYDCALSITDFLHRAGRMARLSPHQTANEAQYNMITFVTTKNEQFAVNVKRRINKQLLLADMFSQNRALARRLLKDKKKAYAKASEANKKWLASKRKEN